MNLIKDDQFKFFTGILKNSVKENEVVTNDEFSLRLGSVKTSAVESLLAQKLEKHYDWTKLEKLILHHLGKFYRSKY